MALRPVHYLSLCTGGGGLDLGIELALPCARPVPHYDVAQGRRAAAVKLGAVEVCRREGYAIRKRLRADPAFIAEWKAAASV